MNTNYHPITMDTIEQHSVWITATPSATTQAFPFYIMEAGHFHAHEDYSLKREQHNSFLLLYTLKGKGIVHTSNSSLELSPENCIIIDCHTPHEYYAYEGAWDFLWIHFEGSGVRPLINTLYPANPHAIIVSNPLDYEQRLFRLLQLAQQNDIANCMEASSSIHALFSILLRASLTSATNVEKSQLDSNIDVAVAYIQLHYARQITIEDMIQDIPISKYHFIRCFRRIMGMTPYSYLTNYRINMSKVLLRTTNQSIASIAEACGFLDTSNFIVQFKKQTGVRPTQYRKDFVNGAF